MRGDVLALDFDGVICDSAGECLFTAYCAYAKAAGLPMADDPQAIPSDWRRQFYRIRPFIRDGKDYLLILYFVHHRVPVRTQRDFDEQSRSRMPDILARIAPGQDEQALEQLFQGTRRVIRANNEAAWKEMNPLYGGIIQGFRACREGMARIYVTTSKPTDAVLKILEHHGVVVPEAQVLGKDKFEGVKDKNAQLRTVRETAAVPFERLHFVDDQVSHLLVAKALNVNCYLAAWGYNTDEQKAEASAAGLTILQDKDVPEWMKRVTES
jgi:phosphoglycolate phosphatase-like HAD superfamily hydrolase